ncbi:MAG: hypothetical protein PHS44_06555 [Candidatus Dojkabacteria bacterium]|nr:hypothetical protein [Candidatus Dojkabacteria bacterium]
MISPKKEYTADMFMTLSSESNVGIDVVTSWRAGRYENYIKEGTLTYGKDYELFPTSGYFIRVKSSGGTVKP